MLRMPKTVQEHNDTLFKPKNRKKFKDLYSVSSEDYEFMVNNLSFQLFFKLTLLIFPYYINIFQEIETHFSCGDSDSSSSQNSPKPI